MLMITKRDEILYNSKLHPEQYSDTLDSAQIKRLHESMMYICQTAVELLADSTKFPDDWLFKHRWGKGKKDAPAKLPNGEAITFLTVGGRTSCVVPSVQKNTGAIAGDIKREKSVDSDAKDDEVTEEPKAKAGASRKRKAVAKTEPEDDVAVPKKSKTSKKTVGSKKSAPEVVETTSGEGESKPAPQPKKEGSKSNGEVSKSLKPEKIKEELPRRRSQRQSNVNESRD
jgi:formamidopyrimidine-DNA glycosylase